MTTFQSDPAAPVHETRPFRWAVRRELWENRSLYIAPVAVAMMVFFGFTISAIGMAARRRATLLLEPAKQRATIEMPYDVAAMMLVVTAFLVGVFYCLDALYGERKDRSILFWKSLPLSDRTTVLAKLSIPMVVLPAITFVTAVITQFLMLLWSTAVLWRSGLAGTTWTRYNLLQQSVFLIYGLACLSLWHAPIYAWLLLISARMRHAIFLWAILPFFMAGFFEWIAFHTTYVLKFVQCRLIGIDMAFGWKMRGHLQSVGELTPGAFLSSPGLWLGLLFAALCIAGAVRLRRNRGPL